MNRFVDGRTPLVIMPETIPAHLEGTDEKATTLNGFVITKTSIS